MDEGDDTTPLQRREQSPDTPPITQNITGMTGGQAQNVYVVGQMHGDIQVKSNDPVQKLKDYTHEKLQSQTEGMIKVSGVDLAIQKLQEKNWVTVTGNAGEGKTTLGYMVLKHLDHEDVFQVDSPEEFCQVSKLGTQRTIMLNDAFGQFTLDLSALDRWRPLISNILDDHEKSQAMGRAHQIRIIFISRWNVLQTAQDYLERYGHKILHPEIVINLGEAKNEEERLEILNYHLNKKDIHISEVVKRRIARSNTPHGFAHCCKIYTELKSEERPDIEEFFKSPLKFVNATTRVLVRTGYMELFENMIKTDGNLTLGNIDEHKQREEMEQAVSDLDGSYIMKKSGLLSRTWTFTHPPIYESVVNIVGRKNCRFIVENASVSVLMQMVNIKENNVDLPGVNIDPEPALLDALCERLGPEILARDFSVFEHKFCENRYFCESLIKTFIHKDEDQSVHEQTFCGRLLNICFQRDEDHSDQAETTMNINGSDRAGDGMLHRAVRGGRHTAVLLLLEHGADVNKTSWLGGKTALHCLCESDKLHTSILQLLITHGADVNKADCRDMTALHNLCKSDEVDIISVQLLITHGADVNQADKNEKTALHYLCESGKVDTSTLQLLITHGADVNTTDEDGKTALHYLCECGKVDTSTLQLLINLGAGVNKTDEDGRTALHYLCKSGKADTSTLQLLITLGADVKKADTFEQTALHYLCKSGKANTNILRLLISHGVDVKKADAFTQTALHYLCESDTVDTSTLQLLINLGADVNKTDEDGWTALHYLCKGGKADTSTLQLLITHGANVNKVDRYGQTALHYLCMSVKVDTHTLQFMVAHGADVKKVDEFGQIPLDYLCVSGEEYTRILQ